jgi:hypothetical protein
MTTEKVEMLPIESKLLRLPIQVAPVERAAVPSALMGGTGVEASQDWGKLASQLIPLALSFF